MKCEICKQKIELNFLDKPMGTYVKDEKGKLHLICNNCQRNLSSKDNILKELG